jgi:hypothetical protein
MSEEVLQVLKAVGILFFGVAGFVLLNVAFDAVIVRLRKRGNKD